jgi:uncharacterized protein YkwD
MDFAHEHMNIVDLILLGIIALSAISGIYRGFISSATGLISWILSLAAALLLYPFMARWWKQWIADNIWSYPLSFLLTLIVIAILFFFFFNALIRLVPPRIHSSAANRLLGIVPGIITGIIYAGIVSLLLLTLPLSPDISGSTRQSSIAAFFNLKMQQAEEDLRPEWREFVDRTMQLTTVENGSEAAIRLPFSVRHPKVRKDLEKEMLHMLNEERKKRHIDTLTADTLLRAVARSHSRDMFARSYFSHMSPGGLSPFDRMHRAGILFLTAGENIALAQTLLIAHDGLMNSPGHRANILNPAFHRVGIGILDGGIFGLMITQDFRN